MKQIDIETEPIFGVHIEFSDKSQPMEYLNLNLISATKVLQEWSEQWILSPEKDCKLSDLVWKWNARPRKSKRSKNKNIEDYSDILDSEYIPITAVACDED